MPNPPASPEPVTPAPNNTQPVAGNVEHAPSEAQSKIRAEMDRLFPGGVVPEGQRFNREADMMRAAGRESAVIAAQATPPGSTIQPLTSPSISPPTPQPITPTAPPQSPAQPVPTTPPVSTPEEKTKQEAEAAAKTTEAEAKAKEDAARNAAVEAAKNADKVKLTDDQKDAAEKAMTPQAGTAFKSLRGELAEANRKLAEVDKKMQEVQTREARMLDEKEAQSLRDRIDGYEKRLSVLDYEATNEYQAQVAVPLQRAEAELVALAQKNSVSEADLRAALNDTDANRRNDRLAEMSTTFNRLDLNRFDRLVGALDDTKALGEQLKADASVRMQDYAKFQEQEQAKQAEQMKADWDKSLDTTLEELGAKLPIFKPTGDSQFDADMAAAVKSVRETDMSSLTNNQIAELFYQGKAFNVVLGLITNLHNKNLALDARVKQLSGTAVSAGGGAPPPSEPETPKYASMLDVVKTLPAQIQ